MRKGPVIIDTGPLVALLNRRERYHAWAQEQFALVEPPAITCEAVITETCFLVRDIDKGIDSLMQLLQRGVVTVSFNLTNELPTISRLLKRYSSVPMSLADACLVRMAELYTASTVLTLDSDFREYRKSGRTVIPTRIPG
jgi:predicted nucleic acid-binding protein